MSIIAVSGFATHQSLADVVKTLAKVICGHFEALNFKSAKGKYKSKTCYLRLSEKLDPVRIVEKINDYCQRFNKRLNAFIPETVPDVSSKQHSCEHITFTNKHAEETHMPVKIKTEVLDVPQDSEEQLQPSWPLIKTELSLNLVITKEIKEECEQTIPENLNMEVQTIDNHGLEVKDEVSKEVTLPSQIKETQILPYSKTCFKTFRNIYTASALSKSSGKIVFDRASKHVESSSSTEVKAQETQSSLELERKLRIAAKHRRKKQRRKERKNLLEAITNTKHRVTKPKHSNSPYKVQDTKSAGLKIGCEEITDSVLQLSTEPLASAQVVPSGPKPVNKKTEIPLGVKTRQIPMKLRRELRIPDENSYDQVLEISTNSILEELSAKYPRLKELCKSTGYKLIEELRKKIFSRVEVLGKKHTEGLDTCFKMTRAYRRAHPHFGDFQFVLSTLHAIQDANGTPRSQLEESDLTSQPVPLEPDLTKNDIWQLCTKYSGRIVKRITEHINSLQSELSPTDSEDDIARKQVRQELKKLNPFLPEVVNQVIQRECMPKSLNAHIKVRVYGEPFLPAKEAMKPFMNKYKGHNVMRSTQMYNMIKFDVPPARFHALLAMNGTVLNGAKLSICSSDVVKYNKKHARFGGRDEEDDEEMDDEENEEYDMEQ